MKLTQLEILNHPWTSIYVFNDNIEELRKSIPRKSGLYSISTNAPKDILKKFGPREDSKHYNLKNKVDNSELIPSHLTINQQKNEVYCVYNGHHANLRQRFSEHFKGSKGTGCLALFEFNELKEYTWVFNYLDLTTVKNYSDSKLLRTILEQQNRANSGWPILCSQ